MRPRITYSVLVEFADGTRRQHAGLTKREAIEQRNRAVRIACRLGGLVRTVRSDGQEVSL